MDLEIDTPGTFGVISKTIHILGMQCNYQVTCNDRAWNVFLKKRFSFLSYCLPTHRNQILLHSDRSLH